MTPNGKWYGVWDGRGAFGVKQDQKDSSNNIFYEKTRAATAKSQTESALALTIQEFKDFKLSVDVRTDGQTTPHSANLTLTTAARQFTTRRDYLLRNLQRFFF